MRTVLAAFLLLSLSAPAQAYSAYLAQQNVIVRQNPDLRSPQLGRLSRTMLPVRRFIWAADGEIWAQVQLASKQNGWLQASLLDPVLSRNLPLTLQDIPAPLLFAAARRQITYASLNDSHFRQLLQKNLILIEIAELKQRWDFLRGRYDFLDISRRVGIRIDAHEFEQLRQEQQALEQHFQRLISQVL